MKIPVVKIAAWIGRAILSAMVTEAAERLSRPKQPGQKRSEGDKHQAGDQGGLQPE